MDNILFTHSYFLKFDPKQWSLGLPYPPLGTLYAAAVMREKGYCTSLYDVMFAEGPDMVIEAIKVNKPEFFVIYDDGFNYLTKMCLTNMREAAFKMCKIARENGCKVIVSSSDATDRFAEYLAEGADFVLLGEGEYTLLELVDALKEGITNFSAIRGVAYQEGAQVIRTLGRPVIRALDELPLPAWDLVEMDLYRQTWLKNAGYFSINMSTTRGCPFKCNWCAKPIYGNRYNSHSPARVVAEMKLLHERYQIDHIWFCDDIFGLKPGWVKEFAAILNEESLHIRFKIQSRADLLEEEETVKALASGGCEQVWIGAESGSQKILDAMDKGITVEQIHQSTALMKKHHIKPSFFIQFGYLGETKEDIDLTIAMINALLPYEIGISVSYPLPGTGFYEKVKDELKKKTNWTDSDEMALMFRNTFPAVFYKQLHVYVHRNYRKHLAKHHLRQLIRSPFRMSYGRLKSAVSILYHGPLTYIERLKLHKLEKTV